MGAAKQVVFVQGGKTHETAYPWMFFHFDPAKETNPGPVTLVFFNYPAGKIQTWKSWTPKRARVAPANPDTEEDLTPTVAIRQEDESLGEEKPSVLALYDWVKKQDAESIISLQVFSHGWMGGPILWNSYEYYGPDGAPIGNDYKLPRDPNDTEFRLRDFFGNNPLAGPEGAKFARAFASDAFIKLWGCVAPDGLRPPVQNYNFAARTDREKAANQAHLKNYTDSLASCFALVMAQNLKLPIWASPLGWGSDPSSTVPTSYRAGVAQNLNLSYRGTFPPDLTKDQWWRVSWFFRNQDRGAKFYQDVLKARTDAVDYIEYTARWFRDAQKLALGSTDTSPVTTPAVLQQQLNDRVTELNWIFR